MWQATPDGGAGVDLEGLLHEQGGEGEVYKDYHVIAERAVDGGGLRVCDDARVAFVGADEDSCSGEYLLSVATISER